jgi:hypothetical protein
VDSALAGIKLNATAGGDLDLSVEARLRDPSVTTFSPALGDLTAGGNINLDLLSAVRDSTVTGPVYTTSVTHTRPSLGGATTTTNVKDNWPNNTGPAPALPAGIFATGGTPINSTYGIQLLEAGGTITVTDPGSATVGLVANTIQETAGDVINVAVSGAIALTALSGDLMVGTVKSTGGPVILTADTGSILDTADGPNVFTPTIEGTAIILTAAEGDVGSLKDALDIELVGTGGGLTALARQGIDILDVAGALPIVSVDAGGAIILGTHNGAITAAAGAAAPEVVGQTIALTAKGGGIGTAANHLKVHATAANGVTDTATGTVYLDQVADTMLLEAGLGWSLGDGGTTAGKVLWGTQL